MIEGFKSVAIFYDSNRKLKPCNLNKRNRYAVKYYFKKETALFISDQERMQKKKKERKEKKECMFKSLDRITQKNVKKEN